MKARIPNGTRLIGATLAVLVTIAVGVRIYQRLGGHSSIVASSTSQPPSCDHAIREIQAGWTLRALCRFPDVVNSLAMPPADSKLALDNIYVGTSHVGGVFRFNARGNGVYTTLHQGTGDHKQFGDSRVSRLAFHDLDGDGTTELLASTSQISPRGRPRLYAWTFEGATPILRGLARPDIRSSWSHGLAFLPRGEAQGHSIFATFCGFGEIVEFQMRRVGEDSGFLRDGLGWKQVGQLPASGEWSETADFDNDGRDELCFAVGFGEGAAAIHAYRSEAPGAALILSHAIDEGGRFGNVRFVVTAGRGDSKNDVVAWWSTDYLYGGQCEVIRYRLDSTGVTERTVIASGDAGVLWPDDGQVAVLDMDGDFRPEVWFAARSGNLYRYDPAGTIAPERILKIDPTLGPIAGGMIDGTGRPVLFLGWGRDVLRLDADPSIIVPRLVSPTPAPALLDAVE